MFYSRKAIGLLVPFCRSLSLAFALSCIVGLDSASAQSPLAEAAPTPEVSSEEIDALLAKLKAAPLEEALNAQVAAKYVQAKQELALAAEAQKTAAEFEAAKKAASNKVDVLKCELDLPVVDPSAEIPAEAKLNDLEQLKNLADVELVRAQTARGSIATLQSRAARRTEVAGLSAAAAKELEELQTQSLAAPPAGQAAELASANRMVLAAKRRRIQKQMAAYEQELLSYDATGNELLKLENDRAKRDEDAAQRKLAMLANVLNERRRIFTEREAAEARRAATNAHPAVRRLADDNRKLAEQRSELASKMQTVSDRLIIAKATQQAVHEKYERVKQQVGAAGFTNAIGQLLRKHRAELPDLRQLRRDCDARHDEIASVQFQEFDLNDRERALSDLDARTSQVLSEIDAKEKGLDETFRAEVRQLLAKEGEILEALISETKEYDTKLFQLDQEERTLIAKAQEYSTFIDQRVLWIRSASVLSWKNFEEGLPALTWLGDSDQWSALVDSLVADALSESLLTGFVLTLLASLILTRRKLKRQLSDLGEAAEKSYRTEIGATVRAIVVTLLLAAPMPLAVWFIAWRLQFTGITSDFALPVAAGLSVAVRYLAAVETLRQICAVKGIAESHFGWSSTALKVLRRHLRWILAVGPCLAGVVAIFEWQGVESWSQSIGRVAFIAGQLALALYMQRVLRPAGGVLQLAIANHRNGLLDRLSPVWYSLFVGGPIGFAVLAGVGFYYTALRLSACFQLSICWFTGLLVTHAVLRRWLMLARRKLAMQQARQRRAAAQAEAKEAGQAAIADAEGITIEEHRLDLSDIDTQTRRLLQSFTVLAFIIGSGLIWSSVLPALGLFSGMTVWGDAAQQEAVTLQKVVLSLVVAIMTVIASKNIPGLMEISILQRLPIEAAVRYAITTISKYVIVIVGVLTSCKLIGIQWAEVQWLAAAVTFGLGFGLQEIFANFISGLIILFERPIRVGDTVTIAGVSGIVSRIRMRATTITDWDRKELIVPNKEFITGQLVNWTLTDSTLRIIFRIGVAHHSDTDLTQQLLLQIAQNHPQVLRDPAPSALFTGFGESTLNFELRVYVAGLEHFSAVQHDTNTGIHRALNDAGIAFAFPKRDINIRTAAGLASSPETEVLIETNSHEALRPKTMPGPSRSAA